MRRTLPFMATLVLAALVATACGASTSAGEAGSGEGTVQELLTYDGEDRQERLLEGAREEGTVVVYTNSQQAEEVTKGLFEEEYPFIDVELFYGSSTDITSRISEEYAAGRHDVDVVQTGPNDLRGLDRQGFLQAFHTSEAEHFPEEAFGPDNLWITSNESRYAMAYNPDNFDAAELPTDIEDLLDEKYKGKMAIGPGTGTRWLGTYVESGYEDVMRGLADQQVTSHNIKGRALTDLVVSGEILLYPAANFAHVMQSQEKGAPVEWSPLNPTFVAGAALAVASEVAHPHAALLWNDFMLSEAGQQVYLDNYYFVYRDGLADVFGAVDYELMQEADVPEGGTYDELYAKWEGIYDEVFMSSGQ